MFLSTTYTSSIFSAIVWHTHTHTEQITVLLVIKFDISIFIYSSAQQPPYRIIVIMYECRDDMVDGKLNRNSTGHLPMKFQPSRNF